MTFHAADPCKFNYPEDHDANGGSSLNVTLRWPANHSSDFHGLPCAYLAGVAGEGVIDSYFFQTPRTCS